MNILTEFNNGWYHTLGWERWLKDFREDVKIKGVREMIKNCKRVGFLTPILSRDLRTERGQWNAWRKLGKKKKCTLKK